MPIYRTYVMFSTYYELDIEADSGIEAMSAGYKLSEAWLKEHARENDSEVNSVDTDDYVNEELANEPDWVADISAAEIIRLNEQERFL